MSTPRVMPTAPRAVVFDWGGTLTAFHSIDLLEPWLVAARHLAPDRVEEVGRALLAAEDEVWARTRTSMRSGRIDEVVGAAATAAGIDVDAARRELALAAYFDHWTPSTQPRPDAVATIAALRERGLRIGLLSNTHWPREQHERWLERDGLLDLIDARVYTSDLERTKPHPDAFGAVLDALGVTPAEAVFVGDRLWDDIQGATDTGMRTVWLRNDAVPFHDVAPTAVVEEMGEVVGVVDGWLNLQSSPVIRAVGRPAP